MTVHRDPAVGITVVVHHPGPLTARSTPAKPRRDARLLKGLALLVALGGIAAGVMHQITLSDPAVTRATWYRVLLWAGLAFAAGLVAVMVAGPLVGRRVRRSAPGTAARAEPDEFWASGPGTYLGPFGSLRGWTGCAAFDPPPSGSCPARLKVTAAGLTLVGPDRRARVTCSWGRLRRVDVHRRSPGAADWVGMTTIDDRYARFEGPGLVGLAEQLRRFGADVRYQSAVVVSGSPDPG